MVMGWGVLVLALWMGLIAGTVSTAHADPGSGKSTTQSAKGSDGSSGRRDGSARVGPRKDMPRRVKARAAAGGSLDASGVTAEDAPARQRTQRSSLKPSVKPLPVASEIRTTLSDLTGRAPNFRASQSLPRTKPMVRRPSSVIAAPVAEAAVVEPVTSPPAGVADVIDALVHPGDPKTPLAQENVATGRMATRGRALLTDVADRISKPQAPQPIAKMAVAATDAALSAPPSVPIVNIVGSLVFNVVGAALQVFSGPPVLPPGSSVTVRSSTLTMPGTNQTVHADWYFPEDPDSATGVIYLQHGFMATGPMYSYTAAYLAEATNSIVVAPTLSSNLFDPNAEWIGGEPMQQPVADLFAGDRSELTASASAAAGHPVELPAKVVLVGHSLGGMLVTGAAGRMVDNGAVNDLAGVVLLDAVDTHNDMPEALDQLTGANYRPVLLISSEPYVWNRNGTVGRELQIARPGEFNGVMLVGGRHIDGLQGANPILQFAEYLIAGFSQPQNVDAVKTISAGWINDMYNGSDDGIHGEPQQRIEIPTPSGTATAVVLPFTSTDPVQATPWDGLVEPILDALFQYAVYEPLAGQSVPVAV